jgi:protein-L-isoaspartate(D-aspartate) O-methyltransferase
VNASFRAITIILLCILTAAGFLSGWLFLKSTQQHSKNLTQHGGHAVESNPDSLAKSAHPSDTSETEPKPTALSEKPESSSNTAAELPGESNRYSHPPLESKEAFVDWMLRNTQEEEYFIRWRWECAQDLLRWSGIKDTRILEAFLRTPREIFIRERNRARAYEHSYMPIGYGATITDPWVVSVMTQAINPERDHRILEIGTGSGYQSAILARLTDQVYTVEIIDGLAEETDRLYRVLEKKYPEYAKIRRKSGDGYFGWPEHAPFQGILVTCAIDHVPPDLLKQLSPGGCVVIPVGPPSGQTLMKITKDVSENGTISYNRQSIMSVKFIPFKTKSGRIYTKEISEDRGSGQRR